MRPTRLLAACLALMTTAALAHCQEIPRELQMGTKTCAGGYATTLDFDMPVGGDGMGRAIEENADLLKEVTETSGFTLTGIARLEFEVNMEVRPEGMIPAHIQFFVAETPTDEELGGDFDVQVVKIEEQKVAYAYHKGGLPNLELTFMKLGQWIFAQALDMAGYPCIVANLAGDEFPLEAQIPVKAE